MNQFAIILVFFSLACCNSTQKDKIETAGKLEKDLESLFLMKNLDTLSFIDQNFDSMTNRCELISLDSIHLRKWSDNFMPVGLVNLSLYSANYYSLQDKNDNYSVISIFTDADDWNRLHLLTIDREENLIDFFEVGENMNYLINQTDSMETYSRKISYAVRLDRNNYKIEQRTETTFDYYDEYKKDSVIVDLKVIMISINEFGEILKNK